MSLLDLAKASLSLRDVERRALWIELRESPDMTRPDTDDPVLLAISAAYVETLAAELGVEPPAWTAEVGAVPPVDLDRRSTAEGLQRMREQSPEPFRKRGLYAPAKYCGMV